MRRLTPLEELLAKLDSGEMSLEEMAMLTALAQEAGKSVNMTFVDDPNSPEGQAAASYVNSHHLLPPNYETVPSEQVAEQGARLLATDTPLEEKKRILMLLGHHGSKEAQEALQRYRKSPDNKELDVWARLAQDEGAQFLKERRSKKPWRRVSVLSSKIDRNSPCPCGSGRKFKKCCGLT
ncbi:MAG: hypothetical protein FJ279_34365 [Planctomycetes bacterium]|nr:hypothetical protein [Planctomycetota bacterium]